MNYLRRILVVTFSVLWLVAGVFMGSAQDHVVCRGWSTDKDDIFKRALEEDKFIIYLAGHSDCPHGCLISDILGFHDNGNFTSLEKGKPGPLKQYVDDNFITWFSYKGNRYNDNIMIYVNEILATKPTTLPLVGIINPNDTTKNFAFTWGSYRPDVPKTVEKMEHFVTIDLLEGSELKWYKDKQEVFKIAKAQNKYVFRLIGKGASPNSHLLIQQLNKNPLKELLSNNYILWYINASETDVDLRTLSGEGETTKSFPVVSIIYHEEPDVAYYEGWGLQKEEALEEVLKSYPVSNEIILPDNKVAVIGNSLQIANQTNNEQIYVYTLTGQRLASFLKKDFTATINTSTFSKGMLIVYSSAGWSTKVLVH